MHGGLPALPPTSTRSEPTATAILAFEAAVQTNEGAHPASLVLANLELKHRHFERSVSYMEKALSIEKNEEVEDILTRVRSLAAASAYPET